MSTHTITPSEELIQISQEMRVQSNRCTQHVLFVVKDERQVFVNEYMDYDRKERKDSDYYDKEYLCASCKTLFEDNKDLPKDCASCDDDCFNYIKIECEPDLNAGVFFTAKACEDHIAENLHHYTKPFSYGISAWRNPEMQTVMESLLLLTGDVPSHYKK